MQKKQAIILFLLILIPFITYYFHPGLVDTDSYYYMLIACHNTSQIQKPVSEDLVGAKTFHFFPCNETIAKIFLFGLCLLSTFILWKIAELFDKQNAWLAPAFAIVFTNIYIWEFLKFENDTIAIPLLFASTWFFLKAKQENKNLFWITSLGLLCLAGTIWKGSFIYLLAFGFSWLPMLFLAIVILFLVGSSNLVVFFPNNMVGENRALSGIIKMFLLLLGLGEAKEAIFSKELAVLFFFGLFSQKYAFFIIPFLAIGVMLFWKKMFSPAYQEETKIFFQLLLKIIVLTAGFLLYIYLILQVAVVPLSQDDWNAITTAIKIADGNVIQNDWDIGYETIFSGGKVAYYGGSNNIVATGLVLTIGKQDCNIAKSFKRFKIYDCG